jgi:hypothetical protein
MSYFQGAEVPTAVQAELVQRSKQLANPGSGNSKWVQSRQPWFKITSLASVGGNTAVKSLSSNAPLKNIGGGYDSNTLRPSQPAVTNIKVTKQGQIGTSRKVNVDITFFTTEQLEEWEPYLAVPGISLRAEWGWSVGASVATAEGPIPDSIVLDVDATNAILGKIKNNANYDGIQGPITNFSYALEGDLWKLSVEFIGAATQLASQPINDASCGCSCTEKDSDKEEPAPNENLSNLEATILAINRASDKDSTGVEFTQVISNNAPLRNLNLTYIRFTAIDRTEKGEIDGGMTEGIERTTEEAFITLESLATLISRVTGTQKDGFNADGRFTFIDPTDNQYMTIPILDPKVNVGGVTGIPTVSVDPYVCILPGQHEQLVKHTDLNGEIQKERSWTQSNPILGAILTLDATSITANGLRPELLRIFGTIDEFYNPNNAKEGYLGKILVNLKHVYKVYKANENGTYSDFMLQLLKDINDVTGNLWEFGIVNITDRQPANAPNRVPNLLSVMDMKNANKKLGVLQIRTVPDSYDNPRFAPLARAVSITSKLTDAMKSQALYGNDTRATASAKDCNERFTLLRRSGGGTISVTNQGRDVRREEPAKNCCTSSTNPKEDCGSETDKGETPLSKFRAAVALLYFKRKDSRVNSAVEAYKRVIGILNGDEKEGNQACPTFVFPFELQLTLDGIGGFVWGQYITLDRLPPRYKVSSAGKDQLVWQVTTVEHTITSGKWETNISTIPRYVKNGSFQILKIG